MGAKISSTDAIKQLHLSLLGHVLPWTADRNRSQRYFKVRAAAASAAEGIGPGVLAAVQKGASLKGAGFVLIPIVTCVFGSDFDDRSLL